MQEPRLVHRTRRRATTAMLSTATKMRRPAIATIAGIYLLGVGGLFEANARPLYAKSENRKCVYCHINPSGGERGFRGIYYKLHGHAFRGFVEKTEAAKAGVPVDSTGADTRPTRSYPQD